MIPLLIGVAVFAYVVWWTIRDHREHKLPPDADQQLAAFHQELTQSADDLVRILRAERKEGGRP